MSNERNKIIDEVIRSMKESLNDDRQTPKLALSLINSKSKFIRSTLVIRVSSLNKKVRTEDIVQACSSIELLHLASLIHDDIIDNASLRRDTPTINSRLGKDIALVTGDYVLIKSIHLAYNSNPAISESLINTFLEICEGQFNELKDQKNINRTKKSYFRSIKGKTAVLFGQSLRIGGMLAKLPADQLEALYNFGINFGIIFQLLDDFLDYFSTEQKLNKPIFQDFREQNFTFPLISLDKNTKKIILKTKSRKKILQILIDNQAIKKTIDQINLYKIKATNDLKSYPNLSFLDNFANQYIKKQINAKINLKYKSSYLQRL
ncbi:MAG: polyprenyl synthetase family protein [Patescibacteria group bacterium]|jgi:geranylgeranyl pyrophosphate synthase|nr:polyprenyl synthetase family protein [Patescibacteria group bacterium]